MPHPFQAYFAAPSTRFVLCALLVVAMFACSRGKESNGSQPKNPAEIVFTVEVRPVETQRVEYQVLGVGAVEAFENVQVTARVAGVLERLHFKEGDEVKQGALLAEIEPQRFQLATASAKAVVERIEAARAEAERELDRAEKLVQEGVASSSEISLWETRLATARAQESEARAALGVAALNLRDARLRAPISGLIQTRNVQTGQYVQPGTVIATLIRRDPLLLRFRVTEAEAARLTLGMTANFSVSGTPTSRTAKITFIAEAAEPSSRMVPVVGEIEDGTGLRPGVFAEVSVPVGANEQALAIPETAIRPSERGFIAYVIKQDVAQGRIVELGLRTPAGLVEVLTGLSAGESLVVRGGEALRDGAKVRIVEPKGTAESKETETTTAPGPRAPGPAPASSTPSGALQP